MEENRSPQMEVLEEASKYCVNVIHSIEVVVSELSGEKKDDTREYLRMTIDAINWVLEMYNATKSYLRDEGITVGEDGVRDNISALEKAVQSQDDAACADALKNIKNFVNDFKVCADKAIGH